MSAQAPVEKPERQALILVGACASVLLLAAGWASWSGLKLRELRDEVRREKSRCELVSARMADTEFRGQLAGALKTLSEDDTPFRTRLTRMAQRMGVTLDGQATEVNTPIPALGMNQIDARITVKDVSLGRFLDYASAVEMEIPDAVVTEVTLKPIPLAGDRWEAAVKVSRRIKTAP